MKTDPIEITGLVLIEKVLEFVSRIPDPKNWTLKNLNESRSSFVLYQQIIVLIEVFLPEIYDPNNITPNIKSVLNGDYVHLRKNTLYEAVFNQMDKTISESKYSPEKWKDWTTNELEFNYLKLIEYKIKLNEIIKYNDKIMEISYPYFYFFILTNEVADNLKTRELDKFLSLVIDPSERIFSKDELIKEYNYPKEDIYQIDLDDW